MLILQQLELGNKNGKWQPYADSDNGEKITNVILHAKKLSKPYIRFNRIQRDFCEERETQLVIQVKT